MDPIQIFSLFLLIYFFFSKKKPIRNPLIQKDFSLTYALFVYVAMVGLPLALVYSETDATKESITSLIRPIRILINFYGVWCLITLYKEHYGQRFFIVICKDIINIVFVNGILMFLQLYFPFVQGLITALLYNNASDLHFQSNDRVGGLYLSGGAVASIYQGLPLLIIPYVVHAGEMKVFKAIILYIALVISIVITGRSGLILIPFSVLVILKSLPLPKRFLASVGMLVFVLVSPQIILYLYGYVLSTGNTMLIFNYERFLRLTPGGAAGADVESDKTVSTILGKFSFPSGWRGLILGDLNFSNYTTTDVSDMGFNIVLYKYGLVGLIIYYLPIIYMLHKMIKLKTPSRPLNFFMKIAIIAYIFLEFKEEVVYARNGYSIILLLFFGAAIVQQDAKNSPAFVQQRAKRRIPILN